jgi:hypothetical protein
MELVQEGPVSAGSHCSCALMFFKMLTICYKAARNRADCPPVNTLQHAGMTLENDRMRWKASHDVESVMSFELLKGESNAI